MDTNNTKNSKMKWVVGGIALLMIGTLVYSQTRIISLTSDMKDLSLHLEVLETNLASTTLELQGTISKTHDDLSEVIALEKKNVGKIEKKLGNYQEDVENITGTVTTLEKLSKTDPELLQKYSKVFFLNEHYAPPRLVEIPNEYEFIETRTSKIHAEVWPFLKQMMDDAKKDGVQIYVSSAFRSFNEQGALKGAYTVTYGAGTANQFSADQGYSEHQLGTTLDFMTVGIGGVLDKFEPTAAFKWLKANGYKYGFILSYPKGNAYYVYEPWHWRFVGKNLATYLHSQNKNFYDVDQRKIDEYLVEIFEN
ncbi:MAG: D-alanyl-D-alanine carboxypeptidase family protein [bacterium]|nr:D-alanyl-D-alanine carboxypeptidase family protein [bacterium]